MSELVSKWRSISRELEFALGRTPSIEEVVHEIGVPEETWPLLRQTILTSGIAPQVSLDVITTHQDSVEDERSPAPDEQILNDDLLDRMTELLTLLEDREATILKLRYGLGEGHPEPMTLKEIGKIVGLTRERVRQIERATLRKLYQIMEGH